MTKLPLHTRGASALVLAFAFAFALPVAAAPQTRCERILQKLGNQLADATCCVECRT